MVDRTSQALQLNTGAGVQAQQSNTGVARPDTDKYAQNREVDQINNTESAGDRILSKLFDSGSKLLDQGFKQSTEEAYLSGVAKAGTIQSEAELDANPLMKDWQVAGYRDTMGRVAAADNEAQIATDMHVMREQSPEKFNEYLAEKRANLVSSWEGMSLPTRQTMFAQQLFNERAAIKKHAAEHYKFGVEQETKSIKVAYDAASSTLNQAKTDQISNPGVYDDATMATFSTIYSSAVVNPKLPNGIRGKLVSEMAQDALANDNQKLYKKIMTTNVRHADGSYSPMGSLISREDTISLVAAERASNDRTMGITAMKFHSELAMSQATWDDPLQPMPTFESVQQMVESGASKGFFGRGLESATKVGNVLGDYVKAATKKAKSAGLANAFITGNVETVNQLNGTRQESLDAYVKTYGSKMPLPALVGTLMQQGVQQGWPESIKAAGTAMQPAWSQLSTHTDINPSNATMVYDTLKSMQKAKGDGKEGVLQSYITAFDEPTQELILRVNSNVEAGYNATDSIHKARSEMLEANKAGNSGLTQALRSKANTDNAAYLTTITPVGVFGGAWGKFKGIFSSDAANKAALQVHEDYWGGVKAADNEGMVKVAIAQDLSDITRDRPFMSAAERGALATARVTSRSVLTPWGPLIGPKGRSLETIYGVKDPERVAKALEQIVKPAPNNRVSFQFDVNGSLLVTERNKSDGMPRAYTIDPMQVKQVAEDQRKAEEAKFNIINGGGSKVGDVQYNGVNAIGAPNEQMYEFRKRLLKHEGYSATAKPDVGGQINKKTGKPVMTVGPGLSDTSDFYPKVDSNGRITPQQASTALRDASEAAAKVALNWQIGTRTQGKPAAFQLFAELAYQGGNYNKAMNPLIVAIRDHDLVKAKVALEATPAWKMAGDSDRRKFYNTALNSILKD